MHNTIENRWNWSLSCRWTRHPEMRLYAPSSQRSKLIPQSSPWTCESRQTTDAKQIGFEPMLGFLNYIFRLEFAL